jgi:hypothetical protein
VRRAPSPSSPTPAWRATWRTASSALGHRLAAAWLAGQGEIDPVSLAEHHERGGEAAQAVAAYIVASERAIAEGVPETARAHLVRAAALGIPDAHLVRYVAALTDAARLLGTPWDSLPAIADALARTNEPTARAQLLKMRIFALRNLDTAQVLVHAPEAIDAALAVDDEHLYATNLSCAGFAAYRRGDTALARRYAELAAARRFEAPGARMEALRAQMFAAEAEADLERSAELSTEVRAIAIGCGQLLRAANECNNLAENFLEIGFPADARTVAREGVELSARCGFRIGEELAHCFVALAGAELGAVDDAIAVLHLRIARFATHGPFFIDVATGLCTWLLERGAPGDADGAALLATEALEKLEKAGVLRSATTLHALRARAHARLGNAAGARRDLDAARASAGSSTLNGTLQLALAAAEVLPAGDAARAELLAGARALVLAAAARRRNPTAFLTGQRLRRRVLELTGGLPV